MELFSIIVLAIGVAMDAFAISICKGITIKDGLNKKALIVGAWFGFFQGLMPLMGFLFMDCVNKYFQGIREYIIFGLLTYVGVCMIIEAFKKEEIDSSLNFKEMLMLSLATSLDALSIGMTLSLLNINIYISIFIISIITFIFCFFGVKIGSRFGEKYKYKAEIFGGIILISMGLKILLQYLM